MLAVQDSDHLSARVVVTGMHLLRRYGYTVREVERVGLRRLHLIPNQIEDEPVSPPTNPNIVLSGGHGTGDRSGGGSGRPGGRARRTDRAVGSPPRVGFSGRWSGNPLDGRCPTTDRRAWAARGCRSASAARRQTGRTGPFGDRSAITEGGWRGGEQGAAEG
ncbi:hypothetical protein [Actinokineospora inagensis]|uniref:hypothetical protein n=1 Tax=Actinokineospora inagensis TaxID=103730 RepID=UPI00040AAE3C|nr:hypothetical protein [Actinokineospora inagensis]